MNKLEFLKLVLNERSLNSIHPMAFCTEDEIHKYNIKEELDESDLLNKIEREKYKLNLIKTYGKIPTKYLKANWTSSLEVYENCCKEFAKTLNSKII